jgi:hypothetical protein
MAAAAVGLVVLLPGLAELAVVEVPEVFLAGMQGNPTLAAEAAAQQGIAAMTLAEQVDQVS